LLLNPKEVDVYLTQRATVVAASIAVLVALSAATVFAGQERQPPQPPPQAQTLAGDLIAVDTDKKMVTVKPATGAEIEFQYNDKTEITGAKGAAGLATMKESKVTVHFTEDAKSKAKLATRIVVEPPK
jgi:hypothetical protein